jgi:hypothetical protein
VSGGGEQKTREMCDRVLYRRDTQLVANSCIRTVSHAPNRLFLFEGARKKRKFNQFGSHHISQSSLFKEFVWTFNEIAVVHSQLSAPFVQSFCVQKSAHLNGKPVDVPPIDRTSRSVQADLQCPAPTAKSTLEAVIAIWWWSTIRMEAVGRLLLSRSNDGYSMQRYIHGSLCV